MIKPGGTDGGALKFLFGLALSIIGTYLLLDSVRIQTGHTGMFSGRMGGMGGTASMGVLFVPLFIGVTALFFNARMAWAWVVTWIGLAIIVIDVVSRIRPVMNMKLSYLIIMLILIAGGLGLMLKAFSENAALGKDSDDDKKNSRK